MPLSQDGRQRRDQIARLARQEARRRRRRRLMGRTTFVCVMVLLVTGVWITIDPRLNLQPRKVNPTILVSPSPRPSLPIESPIEIVRIETDPAIADRLALHATAHWQVIGDDELLKALAAAGKPAGLARMDGRTLLLPDKPWHQ